MNNQRTFLVGDGSDTQSIRADRILTIMSNPEKLFEFQKDKFTIYGIYTIDKVELLIETDKSNIYIIDKNSFTSRIRKQKFVDWVNSNCNGSHRLLLGHLYDNYEHPNPQDALEPFRIGNRQRQLMEILLQEQPILFTSDFWDRYEQLFRVQPLILESNGRLHRNGDENYQFIRINQNHYVRV